MATREQFLRMLWADVINANLREDWIDNAIAESKANPERPFGDIGLIAERLLKLGATRRDLCLMSRAAAYEAVFAVLYMLDDPGVDGDDILMLHESLLGADPSGQEGRPGSAP